MGSESHQMSVSDNSLKKTQAAFYSSLRQTFCSAIFSGHRKEGMRNCMPFKTVVSRLRKNQQFIQCNNFSKHKFYAMLSRGINTNIFMCNTHMCVHVYRSIQIYNAHCHDLRRNWLKYILTSLSSPQMPFSFQQYFMCCIMGKMKTVDHFFPVFTLLQIQPFLCFCVAMFRFLNTFAEILFF